ncbi:MAG: 1,4-dihydroxy-2-naphthoate octaprenyltransferase [Sedimentisphaerales bacterium]|nr:1,4-dihydroxy-2-naphthoate octaprenyltransferase [Sedimentisphaerales bacterium]
MATLTRQHGMIHTAAIWLQAIRIFSLTASIIPVLLGAAWVLYEGTSADWRLMPLIVIASLAIHAATNLVSEYFDYIKNVDKDYTFGGSRVIVEGKLSAQQTLLGGLFLFALTAAIGLIFIYLRGWPILMLGLVGMLGGFFYTAVPVGYKYFGLGDLMVFVLMGPLMVIGSYFVLTGTYNHNVLLVSLPVGCLVAAILSGNNLRDILHDTQAGITTTAGLLGHHFARLEYCALDITAYLIVIGLCILGMLPFFSLIVLCTLPLAYTPILSALKSQPDNPAPIASIDVQTAKLHLAFGVLLIISLVIGAFMR